MFKVRCVDIGDCIVCFVIIYYLYRCVYRYGFVFNVTSQSHACLKFSLGGLVNPIYTWYTLHMQVAPLDLHIRLADTRLVLWNLSCNH